MVMLLMTKEDIDKELKPIIDKYITNNKPKGKWIKESDYKVMGDGYMWNCSECGDY